ncbi:hypothetical protein [Burkholderia lata]|uniref:hypothetical protein n=1 Tax=Burkholderia lata (strain ATCC 17760 / DSM 23089 / LMG 22485 / NCIMB 9086 / R18194 / 383) TaxID=482957 RepID=UPI0018D432C2|nr:hypothetical protein [Burkholderia lata]
MNGIILRLLPPTTAAGDQFFTPDALARCFRPNEVVVECLHIRYPTRMQAVQEGARWLRKVLASENIKRQKDLPVVLQWLDDILQLPDPDWTPEMAQEAAQ